MAFSSALLLTDLNDYISPSQACILPVKVKTTANKNDPQAQTEIKVDTQGSYYEITQDGGESKLEKAAISLNDCLACSGCVTSAESVLITMQSQQELYNVLAAPAQRTIVISLSPQSRASLAAKYQLSPLQVHQRLTFFFQQLGCHHVVDVSFARDLSLVTSAREFIARYQQAQSQTEATRKHAAHLPMLASSCPGWVCYAEKTHGTVLPFISTTKSPQQMMGSLVKQYLAAKTQTLPNAIYHVAVMPCYDKKLEASRPDFFLEEHGIREVDCVLTTGEVEKMLGEQKMDLRTLPESPLSSIFTKATSQEGVLGSGGSSSGGQLEYIMATAARELFNVHVDSSLQSEAIVIKVGKNADAKEYTLEDGNGKVLLRFATAYGFRNIQNIVRKIKTKRCVYDYVEVMACPSGCINGGGQLRAEDTVDAKAWIAHVEGVYRSVQGTLPEENEAVVAIYREWINTPDKEALLHTQYRAVESVVSGLGTQW